MTAATRSSRNVKACIAKGDRCITHDAVYPDTAAQIGAPCWGTGSPKPVSKGAKRILAALEDAPVDPDGMAHVVVQLPVREPEPACVGSNHVPACEHFPAAPAVPPAVGAATLLDLPLDLVDVGDNVRVEIEGLEELAASIAEHGVLQPIKATGPHADGRYLVTWGQRRTVASRLAGQATIRAIVLAPDAEVDKHGPARSIEQLVENLHRADLNPVDRAQAMRAVVDSGISQADLARKLGIAPSTVANDLRLLGLDDVVLARIRDGALSASHGKAIASLPPKQQREIAERVARDKVSTKDLERELEWKRQEADNEAARAKRTERQLPRLLAAVEAAGVAKGATVYLQGSYQFDSQALQKALTAGGWPPLERGYAHDRPAKGKCDCTVVRVEFERTWKVKPACVNDRHLDRARNAVRIDDSEQRKALAAKAAELRARIRPLLEDIPLAVLVLAYSDYWAIPDLVAKAAAADYDVGTLRDELAKQLAGKLDASHVHNDRFKALEAALETVLAMVSAEAAS